jgi:hypothetical protein
MDQVLLITCALVDLSSLHAMSQAHPNYMTPDENGYEYHSSEHSRTFPVCSMALTHSFSTSSMNQR